MHRFIVTHVALVSFTATAQAKEHMADCYGDTLEIMFASPGPEVSEDPIYLSLPNPWSWGGSPVGFDGPLRNAGCLDEPVEMYSVYSSGLRSKFQRAITDEEAEALSLVRSLRLGRLLEPDQLAVDERSYYSLIEKYEWSDIPYGFRRLNSSGIKFRETYLGRSFVAGSFRFPLSYQSPRGHPLNSFCNHFGFCQTGYGLRDMFVDYEYRSTDDYQDRWIKQDQAIRALIQSWRVYPDG